MDRPVPKGLVDGQSMSEITMTTTDYYADPPLEVTQEEHIRNVRNVVQSQSGSARSSSSCPQQEQKRGASRLVSSLMKKNPKHRQSKNVLRDSQSVTSDGLSLEGVVSLAQTVTSHDTLKASNISSTKSQSKKTKGGWSKLKRMMGVAKQTAPSNDSAEVLLKQARSFDLDRPKPRNSASAASVLSADDGNRKVSKNSRVRSSPYTSKSKPNADDAALEQRIIDDSIRGRRDGIDVIALGGAQTVRYRSTVGRESPNDDFPKLSFTGISFELSPADLVSNMLWSSSSCPEIILDGFIPGPDDRWSVKIERPAATAVATNGKRTSSFPFGLNDDQDENKLLIFHDGDSDDGSPALPSQELWSTLWGSDPAPTRLTDLNKFSSFNDDGDDLAEDPVLLLAAECSVPIDVDEDTFIIGTPQHLRAIHDIATVPLSQGNMDLTLAIFRKLLKGMDFMEDEKLQFLKGTTQHNTGMIYLWQGEYEKALTCFDLAFNHRARHLPKNHPDTVVSLIRKGMVLFALGRLGEAIAAFEVAIPMTPLETLVRAKLQNNLGAAYCHQKDYAAALQHFTMSLETQRTWLDSSVRREPLVLDAAVTLSNMGWLYLERSEWDLASRVYEEALLLRTTILRKDEDIVLESMTSLAVAKAKSGDTKHALQIIHSCTRLKNARFGQGSPSGMETTGLMGYLYMKNAKTEDASKCLSAVKRWQKAYLASNHPSVLQTSALNALLQESLIEEVWV